MPFLPFLFAVIRLARIVYFVADKVSKADMAIGIAQKIFGRALYNFQETLETYQDNGDQNDLEQAFIASYRSDLDDDEFQERTSQDRDLMKVNFVDANDIDSFLRSLIQPYVGKESQALLDTIKNIVRQSSQENKLNDESVRGAMKNQLNLLEKSMKHMLLKNLKEKKKERQQSS